MIEYAQLLAHLTQRRSIRQFKETPISFDTLEKLITAAVQAPSASNRQDWKFTLLTARDRIKALADATTQGWAEILARCESESLRDELANYTRHFDWFGNAPAVIAVTCKQPEAFLQALLKENAVSVAGASTSAAMATQNLLLAAESLGLGACCLTGPVAAREQLAPLLQLKRNRMLLCLVAVGYPESTPDPIVRKPIQTLIEVIK